MVYYDFSCCGQVSLSSPVLNEGELEALIKDPQLKAETLHTFFDIRRGLDGSLEKTLKKLCEAADDAVRNGSQLLVLFDRSEELVRIIGAKPCCLICLNPIQIMYIHNSCISVP